MIWKHPRMLGQHHRMVWWMIDAGALKGALGPGWIQTCAKMMGVTELTVRNRLKVMMAAGVVKKPERGVYVLNKGFFASGIPDGLVKLRRK